MNYWIIKSEPKNWSWNDQEKSKTTMWDGVRNYQARNNLIAMKKNDFCKSFAKKLFLQNFLKKCF